MGASKKLKRLTNTFQDIQDVLVDADQRQLKETSVRRWLDRLKDVSYDVEDALDEWNTSKLKLQIESAENALTLKKKEKRQVEDAQGTKISKLDRSSFKSMSKLVDLHWNVVHHILSLADH
ncbi:hypothetical protein EZV62_003908 [Acer yangbiense]|uniref:Disease resistance N-terminal domain-containing protein n=1 Tax=Acer yangbiense TaxID=1000413 RepID=A0A5C7IIA4_9ROSI|nr:hypothetical protein EZV62_003908 [Acer yangbiense]